MIADLPQDELGRVNALRAFAVLDTPPEPQYDDLTRLAAAICGTPISLVSLIDPCRQWFKSRMGIEATETPRDIAFCTHAILKKSLFVVEDATKDDRFKDNPLVKGEPYIRFYAGMPLTTEDGHNIGTLCVIDRTPRTLTTEQKDALGVIARQVIAQLTLRRLVTTLESEISGREKAESELRASEMRFRNTVDRLAEGVFVVDAATRRFVDVNASMLNLLGYSSSEFMALEPFDIVAEEDREQYDLTVRLMDVQLASEGRCDIGRRMLCRKDGLTVPVEIKVTVVPNDGPGLHAVIVRDIREQAAYEEQLFQYQLELEQANTKLKKLATTDGLTNVNNRAAFNEKLTDEYERAVRHSRPLSVILMDVDHFKSFNDTFGHPAGDSVLKTVAKTLAETIRTTDTVARYGGEEFVVVMPDTDFAGAMVLAERCRRAIAAVPWVKRPITVSVGVATLTLSTTNAQSLIEQADQALYRSKQAGRNRVNHGSGSIPLLAMSRA